MKPKYYKSILCLLLILVALGSCKKFIDIDPPRTQLVTESVFDNSSTATAALTAIYAKMTSMVNLESLTGLSSDEFINYGVQPYSNVYQNSLIASDGNALSGFLWSPQYTSIYEANAAIEGLEKSTKVSSNVKNQLIGEAKFLRAFWHFYLVNLYGNIPIVLTTDYSINLQGIRSEKADVYKQIIKDATEAMALLNENYVQIDNTPYPISSAERVRPNKSAAAALLARAYLYSGDYTNAEIQATDIIENHGLYDLPGVSLDNVFLKNSKEAIWQIMASPTSGYNTPEGLKFILTDVPSSANGVSLNPKLLDVFEPGDLRKEKWISSIIVSGDTYFFPYKYKVQSGSAVSEYSMIFRLAEQYLIRAESRIQNNKIEDGISDLNIIRARARALPTVNIPNPLPALSFSLTKLQALDAVQHERQVELFTEGDRWLNIKRTGTVDQIMTDAAILKGTTWKSYQQYYPIPPLDIQNALNIKQNSGY